MSRWDPVDIFEALQEEMDRFWRRVGPQLPVAPRFRFLGQGGSRTNWAPRIDVFEKDDWLIVRADVPGTKKEDVQVEVADSVVVIRGESAGESETRGDQCYRIERIFGSFYRRIPLPFEVDADQVEAALVDGVLEIRIPRPPGAGPEPRKIAIT
jgi:HSP20 family protein